MTAAQLDLFVAEPAAKDSVLVGLALVMPEQCPRCSGTTANIGAGHGPHAASLMCTCGRHLGWMSTATFNFLSDTARQFGRPKAPIEIRRGNQACVTAIESPAG